MMLVKRLVLLIPSLLIVYLLPGCWDSQDINSKNIITLAISDLKDDEYVFYGEIPNLAIVGEGQEGNNPQQFSIFRSTGKTYNEAREHLDAKMDNPIYLGIVGSLLLTKDLAEHGINEYMFRLQTMTDFRKILDVSTISENPDDLLKCKPENNISIGYSIEDTVRTAKNDGTAVVYSASDILEFIYADYCYVIFNIGLRDNKIAHTGYSIIDNGIYHGFIPLEESNGLVWLLADHVRFMYVVPFGENYIVTVETKLKKRKIKAEYLDGIPVFNINITIQSKVMYLNKNTEFNDKNKYEVETTLEQMITKDIYDVIYKSKQLQCDFLGFKEQFRLKYQNELKKINWSDSYLASTINIDVNSNLDPGGFMDFEAQGISNE